MPARETKRAALPLSRTSPAGIIEGYASLFGLADSGGDIVMAGAFSRSLAKRGAAGVKMLWQHNAAEPIGVWASIMEDQKGLRVCGQLDLSVGRAREALSLLGSGAVDGLSIGFRTLRATNDKTSGLRRLYEVDLWEISIVTFPMLGQARVQAVKQVRTPAAREFLLLRLKAQEAALRFQRSLVSVGDTALS